MSNTPRDPRELGAQAEQNQRATEPKRTFHQNKERLYDKIGRKVPVKALDIVIFAAAGLILVALVVGIIMQ